MSALTSQVRKLMREHSLQRIEIRIESDGVRAVAFSHHGLMAGDPRNDIAAARAPEIELAVQGLKKELQRP